MAGNAGVEQDYIFEADKLLRMHMQVKLGEEATERAFAGLPTKLSKRLKAMSKLAAALEMIHPMPNLSNGTGELTVTEVKSLPEATSAPEPIVTIVEAVTVEEEPVAEAQTVEESVEEVVAEAEIEQEEPEVAVVETIVEAKPEAKVFIAEPETESNENQKLHKNAVKFVEKITNRPGITNELGWGEDVSEILVDAIIDMGAATRRNSDIDQTRFILRERFEGASFANIAKYLNITERAATQRITHIRERILEKVEDPAQLLSDRINRARGVYANEPETVEEAEALEYAVEKFEEILEQPEETAGNAEPDIETFESATEQAVVEVKEEATPETAQELNERALKWVEQVFGRSALALASTENKEAFIDTITELFFSQHTKQVKPDSRSKFQTILDGLFDGLDNKQIAQLEGVNFNVNTVGVYLSINKRKLIESVSQVEAYAALLARIDGGSETLQTQQIVETQEVTQPFEEEEIADDTGVIVDLEQDTIIKVSELESKEVVVDISAEVNADDDEDEDEGEEPDETGAYTVAANVIPVKVEVVSRDHETIVDGLRQQIFDYVRNQGFDESTIASLENHLQINRSEFDRNIDVQPGEAIIFQLLDQNVRNQQQFGALGPRDVRMTLAALGDFRLQRPEKPASLANKLQWKRGAEKDALEKQVLATIANLAKKTPVLDLVR